MKYSQVFQNKLGCSDNTSVFDYLKNTFKNSITGWDYFVNWNKVLENTTKIEAALHTLNTIVGKSNPREVLTELLKLNPDVISLLPGLVAFREDEAEILKEFKKGQYSYLHISFKHDGALTDEQIQQAVEFADKTGFLKQLKDQKIRNVYDYMVGVEVGLDSNGRKNRTGTVMEEIVQWYVEDICSRHKLEYLAQATVSKVNKNWGLTFKVDKASRKIDYVVRIDSRLILIECNFYGSEGTKLKSTAGEYRALHDQLTGGNNQFVWITDGKGWASTLKPLEETFNHIDYVLNLDMVGKGILEEIITQ